jgi:hypothetical protein
MGWTDSLTKKSFFFLAIFVAAIYIVFPGEIYGPQWILAAVIIFVISISLVKSLSQKWQSPSEKSFINKLFWNSFILRLISMLILLLLSLNTQGWDMLFYVGARDPQKYYRVASEASVILSTIGISDAYQHIYQSYFMDISDTGFSSFLSILIYLFGASPVFINIILCLIGSFVVVRGYKLASLLFEKNVARLAAIFLMLYPISWFYSSVLLKESLMTLLIIEAIIIIIKLQRTFSLMQLVKVLIIIILLFLFRSAISILLVMVLLFSSFMQYKRKKFILNILVAVIVLAIYFYFLVSTGRYGEYYNQYTAVEEYSEGRVSYMESINPLVAVAGTPVFAVLAFIAPFPSIVKVPIEGGLSHNEYYYHVAGNLFWIILAFFSFYGLYYAIRYHRQEMAPVWSFIIGYQFILLKAMMFTSVRFSYPAKPFLLILAAYGIYQIKNKKWYPIYLVAVFLMILVWNYVRLKGRG